MSQDDRQIEYEVMVTANVEHTPRVHANSSEDAEQKAREYVEEEFGATADMVNHETELPDGRHQVCVWAERHFYPTETTSSKEEAIEAAKEYIQREHGVQTSDIQGASASEVREADA